MINHWAAVDNSFYLKSRGMVVQVEPGYGFKATVDMPVTLFHPNGTTITTTIISTGGGGETEDEQGNRRPIIGLLLRGFDQEVKMENWLIAVHEMET